MSYVDGYVLPIPKKNMPAYRRMAVKAAKVFRDHGALEYRECVLDDVKIKCGIPFTKQLKAKSSDTVVFSWVIFKSRSHRDRVNTKVMTDPRLAAMMKEIGIPFDVNRMVYSGFKTLVAR